MMDLADVFLSTLTAAGRVSPAPDRPGIVLERIARGGGATRWYVIRSPDDLEGLTQRLTPGSVVSLYFDDRFRWRAFDEGVEADVLDLVAETGDAVVGKPDPNGLELVVDVVAGPGEFNEFRAELVPGQLMVYGQFPGRDHDGIDAITVTLPDADGVTRPHPH